VLIPVAIAVIGTIYRPASGAPPPKPLDGNDLVRQMVARYHAAKSIQEDSEATVRVGNNASYVQTTHLIWEQPNRLDLQTTDPTLGTLHSLSDGHTLTVWVGTQNIYVRRHAPTSVPMAVAAVSAATQQMIHLPVQQLLGPLAFLAAGSMPVEAHEFHRVGDQTVEGTRAVLVESQADPSWAHQFLRIGGGEFTRRDVKLWIDPVRHTLLRARCELNWEQKLPATAQRAAGLAATRVLFDEVHRHLVLDAPIRPDTFTMAIPQGAVEEFVQRP
jgi:hypothetical protein